MASSGDLYKSFHNILNPVVIYIGKIGLEYVHSSEKYQICVRLKKPHDELINSWEQADMFG